MSAESAKKFIERMKTDEDFRNKVTECKDNEARKAFVEKEGFNFSHDELKKNTSELSEHELESVSGGERRSCTWMSNDDESALIY
ncbi:MAG: Nif11-like leader peptide family natural product precursor [Candidatus Eremiobacterota bacterium]